MAGAINSPYFWLAAFFAGIFFCAWRIDKAIERLNITLATEPEPRLAPSALAQFKNILIALPLVLGILYLINETSFTAALVVLLTGSLYYWREAYKSRVLPLVAVGLPRREAQVLTLMQWLWLGPLTIALALFAWGRYSAP